MSATTIVSCMSGAGRRERRHHRLEHTHDEQGAPPDAKVEARTENGLRPRRVIVAARRVVRRLFAAAQSAGRTRPDLGPGRITCNTISRNHDNVSGKALSRPREQLLRIAKPLADRSAPQLSEPLQGFTQQSTAKYLISRMISEMDIRRMTDSSLGTDYPLGN